MIFQALESDGFIGRREELAFLHDAFCRAKGEHARFVPIEGEAGIGKSRLIEEFCAEIAPQATLAWGQCSEQIRSPYLPFAAMLSKLDARSARGVRELRDQRRSGEAKAAFFEETARGFVRTARRKPVVAVIEDLQWADAATLELLAYLIHNLDDARVLFLLSLRTGGATLDSALPAFRLQVARRRVSALSLRGLHRNELRYLIAARLRAGGTSPLAPDAVARIESLSEGNPLFAQELARTVSENGELNLATHAPLSLQAMLGERLTALTDDDRAVLVRAAIIGRRFNPEFLSKIVELPLDRVFGVLQRAADAELISASPASDEFTFRHAMIRQALADRLIVGLAAPLHARIAAEIESTLGAENHEAELAYHWSAARVADKARFYNERAAEAAWALYAYRDAIAFYTTALYWQYPSGAARAAVYERLGTLLYIEGQGEEPTQWFERCRAEYASVGNTVEQAHALLRLADQYWVDARTGASLQAAQQAAATLEQLDRPAMLAEALLSQARFCVTTGDALQARAQLDAAATLADHFDATLQTNFYEVRAETHAARGDAFAALNDCRAASSLAAAAADSESIAQVENNYAIVAADLGELDVAAQRHEIALTEARRTSMLWRVAYCALSYANTLMLRGELERARRLAWEAIESGVNTATFKTKAAAVGIPLALLLNDRPLLDACADESALEYAARSQEPQRIAAVGAAFAELRSAQGAPDIARDLLASAMPGIVHPHRCLSFFMQVALVGNACDRAWARAMLTRSGSRSRLKRACALLFESLTESGEPSATSRRRARLAAIAFGRMGWRLWEARALESAGSAEQAQTRYAAMGSVRDVERLRGRESSSSLAIPLSPRQLEIARLVARGQTNRSIAQVLHISEHTVEHHLSTIFARLGLHSRSALAAQIGRLGEA